VVEAFVARSGQAVGKIADEFEPHFVFVQMLRLDAGDGLDVGGDAFLDPVMIFGDGGESEMYHFVGHHPVRFQSGRGCFVSHANRDEAAVSAERAPVSDAPAIGGSDADRNVVERVASVIGGDGFSGGADPFRQLGLGNGEFAAFDRDVNTGVADGDGRGHGMRRSRIECNEREKD